MDVKITFDRYNVIEADKINDVKVVMVKGEKGDVGYPTDAQVETAVDEWLTAHPEVTTTVQDGSITEAKLANDVKGMFDEKADAIIKTASGSIASFDDGGENLPLKSLLVNIEPKQSGSGDPSPSNVRPISGYSEVKTTRCGKNLIDDQTAVIYSRYIQVVGTNEAYWREANDSATMVLPCKPNAVYTLSINAGSPIFARMCWADFDPTTITSGTSPRVYGAISVQPYTNITITTGATAKYLIMQTGKSLLTTRQAKVQIELGSTVTAYEPYNGTTYTTSLGQTVYGGTLDVVSGVLTIDKALVDLGSLSWSRYSSASTYTYRARISDMNATTTERNSGLISSAYTLFYGLQLTALDNNTMLRFGGEVFIRDDRYTDATAFKTAMNGVQLVYELATPTEITLTPTQVTTLLGNNNIWADSGTVEVEIGENPYILVNPTKFEACPIFEVEGAGTLSIGDTTLTISNTGTTIIDTEMMEAYEDDNGAIISRNDDVEGGFPTLTSGINNVEADGLTSVKVTPKFWEL